MNWDKIFSRIKLLCQFLPLNNKISLSLWKTTYVQFFTKAYMFLMLSLNLKSSDCYIYNTLNVAVSEKIDGTIDLRI